MNDEGLYIERNERDDNFYDLYYACKPVGTQLKGNVELIALIHVDYANLIIGGDVELDQKYPPRLTRMNNAN